MLAIHITEFRDFVKKAKEQRWVVEQTRGSHWCFIPPDKSKSRYICSGSPGNPKFFVKRVACELRQRGLT
jgi:hypothetical protein